MLFIAACTPPETLPADFVPATVVATVEGRALNEDGLPLAMGQVVLSNGVTTTTVATDADGLYSFTLKGSETWKPHYDGGFEHQLFTLSIPGGAGLESQLQFTVRSAQTQLPDLQRWRDLVTVIERPSGDLELTVAGFDAAAASDYFIHMGQVRATTTRDGQRRITTLVVSVFDREDFDFGAEVINSERRFDGFIERHAQPVTLARGSLVPLSRGATCDGAGPGCPLTDGSSMHVTLPRVPGIDFTLSAPQRLTRACFHGLMLLNGLGEQPIALTGSADGTNWVPLAQPQPLNAFNAPEGVLLLDSAPAVRFVRVRPVDTTDSFFDGSELSFY